jgi:hypothetical protein
MRFFKAFLLLTLLAPGLALAAGFAKGSLFLSKSPVTEGETVFIHAVVANDSTTAFTGDVIFEEDEKKIGTVAVVIAAGGAETASLSWAPTSGSHPIVAELTAKDGTVVEKLSATFSIAAKPEPKESTVTSSIVQPSDNVQEAIAGISPGLASASEPVFEALDGLRQKGAEALDKGIEWAKNSEESADQSGIGGTVLGVVKTGLTYLMELLRFVIGNAGVFYPAFALAFLYVLWRTYKHFRRPSYE